MPETIKDDEKLWAFWLVGTCLPHDEDVKNPEAMSSRQFYIGLAVALAIVMATGMLIRGCSL